MEKREVRTARGKREAVKGRVEYDKAPLCSYLELVGLLLLLLYIITLIFPLSFSFSFFPLVSVACLLCVFCWLSVLVL